MFFLSFIYLSFIGSIKYKEMKFIFSYHPGASEINKWTKSLVNFCQRKELYEYTYMSDDDSDNNSYDV